MRIDRIKWCAFAGAGTILVLTAAAYLTVRAALPRRDGEVALAGLTAPLAIELDERAIPRIRASSFEDALRGEGYMHAQERFFQMDLLRRSAAGELAELFGERALPLDRAQRPFDFRRRAQRVLGELPEQQVAWLTAYTEGVNAGLDDLGARPPEYWLFGARPTRWRSEDSLLVVFGFYTRLSNNEYYERPQGLLHEVLPQALYEFLTPSTSRFDRPLAGTSADPTGGYVPAPIPGPEALDLRTRSAPGATPAAPRIAPPLVGPASNQWVLDASRTVHGGALLANDPHLDLRLPNVFYRCELHWPGGVLRGVSIPGLPAILIGASATLAWGATVSNADQSDWVVVTVDANDPSRYAIPGGSEPFATEIVQIAVAGRAPEPLELRSTRWGPITGTDWRGRPLALRATWLEPGGLDLTLLELATAANVSDGVAVLARWAGPSLNWTLADSQGRIGWTVNGPLPRRVGFDGSRPESWADGSRSWDGESARPTLLGRADGTLVAANNRTLPLEQSNALSRMWMTPLRAARITELLAAAPKLAEPELLAMQLDTRARGYDEIRDVLLEIVPSTETDPLLARARAHALAWNGRADVDQRGFRIVQLYYRALLERVLSSVLAPAVEADPTFVYRWPLADEPLRRLLEERPVHLLTHEFADWPTFLRAVLRDALRALERDAARPGIDAPWGEVNVIDVAHPFAGLPVIGDLLGPWLRLPQDPVPGATLALRVATPSYGALIRLAVSPSYPENGILEMSAGQSGHFLSPHFADLQADWVAGAPTPFLAGPTVTRISLVP
jgi:penicillin amidase